MSAAAVLGELLTETDTPFGRLRHLAPTAIMRAAAASALSRVAVQSRPHTFDIS
jgi:hypothetical protein